jgi:hypothetical protein
MASSGSENFVIADRPPDPAAAAAAVREARRRLLASHGLARAFLGLFCLASFTMLGLTLEYRSRAYVDAVILLVLVLVTAEVLLPMVIARLRRAHGGTAISRLDAALVQGLSRSTTLLFLASLAANALFLVAAAMIAIDALGVDAKWIAGLDTAVVLTCTAAVVLLFIVRYARLGLGEDLLIAAGLCATGILLALCRAEVRLEFIVAPVALASLTAGLSLHMRWRRWATPPSAENGAANGGGGPAMNPQNQEVGPNERPPDARLAEGVQQMSARIAESATGLSLLVAALAVTAAFALLYTLGDHSSPYYAAGWIAVLAGLGVVHWSVFFWIQKRRAGAGLPLVEARRPGPGRILALTVALGAYMVGGCLLMVFLNAFSLYRLILIVPFGVLYGLAWGAYGLKRRQWEDVIQGMALCGITAIVALDPRFPPEVWLTLFAFCFVPSGLVKHLRWRRWVRSVQPCGPEPSAEGVRP